MSEGGHMPHGAAVAPRTGDGLNDSMDPIAAPAVRGNDAGYESNWMARADELVRFVAHNGRTPRTDWPGDPSERSIGTWLRNQHAQFKRGCAPGWKLDRVMASPALRGLIAVSPRRSKWQARAGEFAEFLRTNGRFPSRLDEKENALALWAYRQGVARAKGELDPAQAAALDEALALLLPPRAGRQSNDGMPGPAAIEMAGSDDVSLGGAEFRGGPRRLKWFSRADELVVFLTNNQRWPSQCVDEERSLSVWAYAQRVAKRQRRLDAGQAAALDEALALLPPPRAGGRRKDAKPGTAALESRSQEDASRDGAKVHAGARGLKWRSRADELVAFLTANRRWPVQCVEDERSLSMWAYAQRVAKRQGRLNAEQEASLNKALALAPLPGAGRRRLEGAPSPLAIEAAGRQEAAWRERLQALVSFGEKYGRWPRARCCDPSEETLARWQIQQRTLKRMRKLPEWKVEVLERHSLLLKEYPLPLAWDVKVRVLP